MSTLKTIIRGESLSLGFIFPNGYNLARIEDIKVYVGSKLCEVTRNETIVTCRIKSDDTKNFGTINKVTFWLDDSSLGVQKMYVGDICVDGTNASASNQSVNLCFDIVVNLTISETAISVDSVLYDVMKGDKGDAGEVEEAPIDNKQYVRKNADWSEIVIPEGGSEVYIGADEPTTDTDELWIDINEDYPETTKIVATYSEMIADNNQMTTKYLVIADEQNNGGNSSEYTKWSNGTIMWAASININNL